MDPHALFNRKLLDFVADLKLLKSQMPSSDLPDMDMVRTAVNFAASLDERNPQRVFDIHVAKQYEEHIMKRDEHFLLEADYTHIDIDFDIIDIVKSAWKNISAQDKDAIWQHLQVLLLLNRKCMERNL